MASNRRLRSAHMLLNEILVLRELRLQSFDQANCFLSAMQHSRPPLAQMVMFSISFVSNEIGFRYCRVSIQVTLVNDAL